MAPIRAPGNDLMKISLGPILYYWPRDTVFAFYESIASSPVDVVYLGETVCSRRHELRFDDWMAIARTLAAQGKEVVLSTLALPEAEADLRRMRKIVDNGEFAAEVNDMGSLSLAAGRAPFVIGPHINCYSGATLDWLTERGARRWVAPVEITGDTLRDVRGTRANPCEVELFAVGRAPLAISARCFTAPFQPAKRSLRVPLPRLSRRPRGRRSGRPGVCPPQRRSDPDRPDRQPGRPRRGIETGRRVSAAGQSRQHGDAGRHRYSRCIAGRPHRSSRGEEPHPRRAARAVLRRLLVGRRGHVIRAGGEAQPSRRGITARLSSTTEIHDEHQPACKRPTPGATFVAATVAAGNRTVPDAQPRGAARAGRRRSDEPLGTALHDRSHGPRSQAALFARGNRLQNRAGKFSSRLADRGAPRRIW